MVDLYGSPEKFGLEPFGEIQWGEASYDFNLTVVWRRTSDGAFLYANDSGCSCPSPFEDTGIDDLKPATPLADFKAELDGNLDYHPGQADEVARLLERMHKAGAR